MIPLKKVTHDYVARKKCGCVVAIGYDLGNADTGRMVADWINRGYTTERMLLKDACAALLEGDKCQHEIETVLADMDGQLALGL